MNFVTHRAKTVIGHYYVYGIYEFVGGYHVITNENGYSVIILATLEESDGVE